MTIGQSTLVVADISLRVQLLLLFTAVAGGLKRAVCRLGTDVVYNAADRRAQMSANSW